MSGLTVYLSDSTSYLGKALADTFRLQEHEIFKKEEKQEWADVDPETLPDIFVLNLNQDQDKLHEVRTFLSTAELERATTVIGVSTVMTWGKTAKNPAKALKETKYTTRKSSPKYKVTRESETLILRLQKDNLQSFVVAPGILYGRGEDSFHLAFKDAWLCESKGLTYIGDGKNKIPTIHVQDLANFVSTLMRNPAAAGDSQYFIAVDSSKLSQQEIIQNISKVVGSGGVASLSAQDEQALLNKYGPIEILTTNMNFNFDDLKIGSEDVPFEWIAQGGLLEYLPTLREEFVAARKLKPLRVMLHGAPGSGKSHYAKLLAKEYYLPRITVSDAIEEVKAGNSKLKDKVMASLNDQKSAPKKPKGRGKAANRRKPKKGKGADDDKPRIPDNILTEIMRTKLMSPACRNKGYILDGYPRTYNEAKLLFATQEEQDGDDDGDDDDDDNKQADPDAAVNFDPITTPNHIICLDVTEDAAAKRFTSLKDTEAIRENHNDEEGFRRRWQDHKRRNDPLAKEADAQSPLTLISQLERLEVPEESSADDKKGLSIMRIYLDTGGKPFNYHPTLEEQAALKAIEDAKQAKETVTRKKEEEKKAKEEAVNRQEAELANRLRRELVLGEDQKLVEASSLPLRKYLMQSVVPALVDGLLDVCKVQPDDPVDHLAEYLFQYATSQNSS